MEAFDKAHASRQSREASGQCETQKSIEQLQTQWAGGIDVWPKVPTSIKSTSLDNDTEHDMETMSIQNRVLQEDEIDSVKPSEWPNVVRNSILFGFGAYNPRGQELPNVVNENRHARLQTDIRDGLSKFEADLVRYWEGASIWEDGSSEKGFVIAFSVNPNDDVLEKGYEWVVQLATKYNQGAIYRFDFIAMEGISDAKIGRLLRTTIPVLDAGTDSKVLVIRDERTDLTPFLKADDSR
jgi:hypothetical protein